MNVRVALKCVGLSLAAAACSLVDAGEVRIDSSWSDDILFELDPPAVMLTQRSSYNVNGFSSYCSAFEVSTDFDSFGETSSDAYNYLYFDAEMAGAENSSSWWAGCNSTPAAAYPVLLKAESWTSNTYTPISVVHHIQTSVTATTSLESEGYWQGGTVYGGGYVFEELSGFSDESEDHLLGVCHFP